jgi:hypothetical protein
MTSSFASLGGSDLPGFMPRVFPVVPIRQLLSAKQDAGRRFGWHFRKRSSGGFHIVSCGKHESRQERKTSPGRA